MFDPCLFLTWKWCLLICLFLSFFFCREKYKYINWSREVLSISSITQWGQGGRVPPDTSHQETFCWPTEKKKGRKKRENKEERKIWKGKVENWKWKAEKLQNEERTFLFIFFFFDFHFWKPLKFVLGLPKWEFSTRKNHFTLGKISGKMTLPPLKNIPLAPLLFSAMTYGSLWGNLNTISGIFLFCTKHAHTPQKSTARTTLESVNLNAWY